MCLLRWQFNKESIECEIEHSYSLAQRAGAGLTFSLSLRLIPRRPSSPRERQRRALITVLQLKLLEQKCLFSPNRIVNY